MFMFESIQILKRLLMLIVAVAWLYVTVLMAFTEPTVVAGMMTFLLYGVLPLGILFYLTGGKRRKRKRAAEAARRNQPPTP
jgi:fatty acid desaturase